MGKLPPQAIDLEEAVLGSLMLDKDAITKILDILKPESFYKEAHQKIFGSMVNMFRKGTVIDILTVTQELKNSQGLDKVGGAYYISTLTNRVASSANLEFHARIIQQKYMQRELIRSSTSTIEKCYEDTDDVFDILDSAQSYLNNITAENIKKQEQDTTSAFGELVHHLEAAIQNKNQFTGIPCTIQKINEITSGWQKSDLIIVGGRPGAGKSAFIKSCINGCVASGAAVAVFSLEMSTMQLVARLVSEQVGVSAQQLMMGKFQQYTDFKSINAVINKYYSQDKSLLFIDDSPTMSINEFKAKSKRLYSERGIGLIVVDYLQLLSGSSSGKGDNRVLEIGEISRGLKSLAKELNVPVIALSQLSRSVETNNPDYRPKLSHLRESGSIEQDADLVLFLYRPDYYVKQGVEKFREIQYKGEMISSEGFAEAIIAKHRNGALGTVAMRFVDQLTMFQDWDDASRIVVNTYPEAKIKQRDSSDRNFETPAEGSSRSSMPNNNDFLSQGAGDIQEPPF